MISEIPSKKNDFTVVLGVDKKTIEQLKMVWPTWVKHKPTTLCRDFLIFYNYVSIEDILNVMKASEIPWIGQRCSFVPWPPRGVTYDRTTPEREDPKWYNPQRAKMLAGFVHIPAKCVTTPYWLKLDLDVIAGPHQGDDWVVPGWFDGNPSIIASSWPYTKPADQILKLDAWVAKHHPPVFLGTQPLNLRPNPGSDKVIFPRIASWCAFFSTEFTKVCSKMAEQTCGAGQLPVDSQDGYMWYVAHRCGFAIRTYKMKKTGWCYRSTERTIREQVEAVMGL